MNETKQNLRDFYRMVRADDARFESKAWENVEGVDTPASTIAGDRCERRIVQTYEALFDIATSDYEVGKPITEQRGNEPPSVTAGFNLNGVVGLIWYDGRDGRITRHT